MRRLPGSLLCLGTAFAVVLLGAPEPTPNHLSPDEQASGWKLLFDGASTSGWEGMAGTPFPSQSWAIEDGAIRTLDNNSGGDVISLRPYDNFELAFDWKISPGGNSGVKYMVQKQWFSTGFRPDLSEGKKHRMRLSAIGLVPADAAISAALRKLLRPFESHGLITSVSPTFSIRTERFDSHVWKNAPSLFIPTPIGVRQLSPSIVPP